MDENQIKEALQEKFTELDGKFATPDQLEAIKTAMEKEITEKFEGIKTSEELESFKTESAKQFEDLKAEFEKKFNDQEEILKKQGEEIAKKKTAMVSKNNPLAEFETKFNEAVEAANKEGGFKKHDEIEFEFKVNNPFTFSTEAVADPAYPGGTAANASDAVFNQETSIGNRIYESPKRIPSFMNGLRTEPISGGQLGAVVKVSEQGDAAVVNECEVKPYATFNFDIEYTKAGTIAVLWKESKQWRTDLSRLLPAVRRHMQELMSRKIENVMFNGDTNLQGFKNFASAYTPNAALVFNSPSKLEAIGATIYSLQSQEYTPTTVIVHPIDYATMVHHRAGDGHYDILNNGSIQLINGNTIISGGNVVNLTVSTLATVGEFFVGDMNEAIIGLGGSVRFDQGLVNDDFERNLVTNRLEIDAALLIPSVVRGAFVNTTYAAVLPQITV